MAGPLGVHGEPVKLPAEAHGKVGDVDHFLHLAHALGQDLAHLQGDEVPQRFLLVAKRLTELTDHLAPLGGRCIPPGRKRLLRRDHRLVVILDRGPANVRDDRTVVGRGGGKPFGPRLRQVAPGVHARVVLLEAEFPENALDLHQRSSLGGWVRAAVAAGSAVRKIAIRGFNPERQPESCRVRSLEWIYRFSRRSRPRFLPVRCCVLRPLFTRGVGKKSTSESESESVSGSAFGVGIGIANPALSALRASCFLRCRRCAPPVSCAVGAARLLFPALSALRASAQEVALLRRRKSERPCFCAKPQKRRRRRRRKKKKKKKKKRRRRRRRRSSACGRGGFRGCGWRSVGSKGCFYNHEGHEGHEGKTAGRYPQEGRSGLRSRRWISWLRLAQRGVERVFLQPRRTRRTRPRGKRRKKRPGGRGVWRGCGCIAQRGVAGFSNRLVGLFWVLLPMLRRRPQL